MPIPLMQAVRVGAYVVKQHLAGRKRYPLVLMLEPLFRCNLACAGCGKIQYPAHILKKDLTPEECFKFQIESGVVDAFVIGVEKIELSAPAATGMVAESFLSRRKRQSITA